MRSKVQKKKNLNILQNIGKVKYKLSYALKKIK